MKAFEFDDIEISDEKEEVKKEEKQENLNEDPLYQKFSFDIDTDSKEKVKENKKEEVEEIVEIDEPQLEDKNINDLFDDEEDEPVEDKPLFSNSNIEIDNPFVKKEIKEEEKISEEEQVENMYKEANKNIKPVISFDEKELDEKEDALEEALSHTTKFTPFKEEKPDVNDLDIEETKDKKDSNGIAYLVALFIILLIAIFVIPKIASLL